MDLSAFLIFNVFFWFVCFQCKSHLRVFLKENLPKRLHYSHSRYDLKFYTVMDGRRRMSTGNGNVKNGNKTKFSGACYLVPGSQFLVPCFSDIHAMIPSKLKSVLILERIQFFKLIYGG